MLHGNLHFQIHLTDIGTGNIAPDLLAYLASYSGVEKLKFWGLSSMNPDEPVDAAHLLLRTVDLLPHLQRLTIDSEDPDSLRNVRRGCLISSEDSIVDRAVKTMMQDFCSRIGEHPRHGRANGLARSREWK
ncbi:hypothetical protein DFH08DRAFT_821537 [Mycena albidolilacea]|uniref:Uncharacterized protein n=1 Tax=Mycena albidolilacea TaxID=1033008 RepID=A0AAD6Z9N4_9AGAR|nr:hypothetical protein DFH08DRAFT_821537 [Mycena albidolilacea]